MFKLLPERHSLDKPVKVQVSIVEDAVIEGFILLWTPEGIQFMENGVTQKFLWSEIRSLVVIPDDLPTFYKATIAAEILLVKIATIRRWIKDGKLEGYQRNNRWMVSRESIQRLLKERNGEAA